MASGDLVDEPPQRVQYIRERLPGAGFGIEDDEIGRMSFVQSHADFGVALEATDPGAVARAWIDDDHRAGFLVDAFFHPLAARSGNP